MPELEKKGKFKLNNRQKFEVLYGLIITGGLINILPIDTHLDNFVEHKTMKPLCIKIFDSILFFKDTMSIKRIDYASCDTLRTRFEDPCLEHGRIFVQEPKSFSFASSNPFLSYIIINLL